MGKNKKTYNSFEALKELSKPENKNNMDNKNQKDNKSNKSVTLINPNNPVKIKTTSNPVPVANSNSDSTTPPNNNKFYNPYHFIPIGESITPAFELKEFKNKTHKTKNFSHACYHNGSFSGRMICSIETISPIFIGSQVSEEANNQTETAKKIAPFELELGVPAIPGSSIRGLISSIAEAASNSAMRALEKKDYSFRNDNSYDFFKSINPNLLPLNDNPIYERDNLTMAEMMFGFVEQKEKKEASDSHKIKDTSLCYASRIRFSNALVVCKKNNSYYDEEVTLKILDSPKPPCPMMYFKKKNENSNSYIKKKELKTDLDSPQGRKVYLHHKIDENNKLTTSTPPWKTSKEQENYKQKNRITPIKKKTSFCFHIDFNNLSQTELKLLCYSLRPDENFHHKIGMGKPIGLGSIKIDIKGLFIIERQLRYDEKDIFNTCRYHKIFVYEQNKEFIRKLNDCYIYEKEALDKDTLIDEKIKPETLSSNFAEKMNKDIKKSIELLGNPGNINFPVHTPQIMNVKDLEKETFKWFKNNQENQKLNPLNKDSKNLPFLLR